MTADVHDETGDIPPALTPDQWREREFKVIGGATGQKFVLGSPHFLGIAQDGARLIGLTNVANVAALIALANAAFPDEDPRKLTWETVDALRRSEKTLESASHPVLDHEAQLLGDLADVLASYLPPRAATAPFVTSSRSTGSSTER